MQKHDDEEITVGEFVEMVWGLRAGCGGVIQSEVSTASLSQPELLRYGHFRGWLEDSDERHPESLLNRQTAARIIHQFMVVELHMADVADISAAEKLRDLYTCRVCANHIAQVYARGIMGAEEVLTSDAATTQPVWIFNHLKRMSYNEAREAMERLRSSRPERTNDS